MFNKMNNMHEPLELEGYGVKLRRLTEDKIELVRHWRNDPKIQKYMEYREHITAEQQLAWFHRINNDKNFYFLIIVDGKEIGCVSIRDIDYEKLEGEPGIFIGDDDYLNNDYSFCSALCLLDFCFETLQLKELIIHVLKGNKRAIQYNKMLGYVLSHNQDNVENQEYRMFYEKYKTSRDRIVKYLNC